MVYGCPTRLVILRLRVYTFALRIHVRCRTFVYARTVTFIRLFAFTFNAFTVARCCYCCCGWFGSPRSVGALPLRSTVTRSGYRTTLYARCHVTTHLRSAVPDTFVPITYVPVAAPAAVAGCYPHTFCMVLVTGCGFAVAVLLPFTFGSFGYGWLRTRIAGCLRLRFVYLPLPVLVVGYTCRSTRCCRLHFPHHAVTFTTFRFTLVTVRIAVVTGYTYALVTVAPLITPFGFYVGLPTFVLRYVVAGYAFRYVGQFCHRLFTRLLRLLPPFGFTVALHRALHGSHCTFHAHLLLPHLRLVWLPVWWLHYHGSVTTPQLPTVYVAATILRFILIRVLLIGLPVIVPDSRWLIPVPVDSLLPYRWFGCCVAFGCCWLVTPPALHTRLPHFVGYLRLHAHCWLHTFYRVCGLPVRCTRFTLRLVVTVTTPRSLLRSLLRTVTVTYLLHTTLLLLLQFWLLLPAVVAFWFTRGLPAHTYPTHTHFTVWFVYTHTV